MCWLKAQQSRELQQWARTSLPAQQHRFHPSGDTCPLPPSVLPPAIFSHISWGCRLFSASHNILQGLGVFILLFFIKPSYVFGLLILHTVWPPCYWGSCTIFLPLTICPFWSRESPFSIQITHRESLDEIVYALNNTHSYPLSYTIVSQSDLFMNKVRHLHQCSEFRTTISLKMKKNQSNN